MPTAARQTAPRVRLARCRAPLSCQPLAAVHGLSISVELPSRPACSHRPDTRAADRRSGTGRERRVKGQDEARRRSVAMIASGVTSTLDAVRQYARPQLRPARSPAARRNACISAGCRARRAPPCAPWARAAGGLADLECGGAVRPGPLQLVRGQSVDFHGVEGLQLNVGRHRSRRHHLAKPGLCFSADQLDSQHTLIHTACLLLLASQW